MNTEISTGQAIVAYLILILVIAAGVSLGIAVSNKLL